MEINLNKDSEEYGKVIVGTDLIKPVKQTSGSISPRGVSIKYYSFTSLENYVVSSTSFNISQPTVTVKGWQNYNSDTWEDYKKPINMKYEIIKVTGNTTAWFGQKTIPNTYPSSGSGYYEGISLTQSAITGAQIRITNLTGTLNYIDAQGMFTKINKSATGSPCFQARSK